MKGRKTMSDFKRKAIAAITAFVCVALTSVVSCESTGTGDSKTSKKNNNKTSETSTVGGEEPEVTDVFEHVTNDNGNVIVTPFQFGSTEDLASSGLTPPEDVDLDADDPVQPATEVVEVTEAGGEKVTDANGATVTEIVTKPTDPAADYVSKTESVYCLWIDISKDSDYIFNDDFIKVTFQLKDNIPEKDYAVRFNPDFSSIAGVSTHPDKVLQGTIRVGGSIDAQDVSGENGFVAYGDNVSAKPGDTVDYYINLKNNPGLAGMLVWVYYDANAMDIKSIAPSGDFAGFARGTQVGKNSN